MTAPFTAPASVRDAALDLIQAGEVLRQHRETDHHAAYRTWRREAWEHFALRSENSDER